MHDNSTQDARGPHGPVRQSRDPLEELRRLLIGDERRKLDEVLQSLEDPRAVAKRISHVLPDAIRMRGLHDESLSKALTPTVQDILRDTVKKNPRPLIDVLSPVIGSAIRRAVAEALRRMVQSLNQILEHSFSFKSLKWRFQAMRSGRPFSEIALLHSLIFTVEQVFLIHRHSGLLLLHVSAETAVDKNPDTVSAMLTAVQDFINDSFNQSSDSGLASVRVGELTLIIEPGPRAVIAAVVRGIAPPDLRDVLRQTVDDVHHDLDRELLAFTGDTAPFAAALPALQACLQSRYRQAKARPSPVLVAVAAMLLLAAGFWSYGRWRDSRHMQHYLASLAGQPGIVVTGVRKQNGKYVVSGLRDPLAADPAGLLAAAELTPEKVKGSWQPVCMLTDEFVLQRAKKALKPPPGISLRLRKGLLTARGPAPHAWIAQARKTALLVPGVTAYHDQAVTDDTRTRLRQLSAAIEQARIRFAVGSTRPESGQEAALKRLSEKIARLRRLSAQIGGEVTITVIGHADDSGPRELNRKLRLQRAAAVRNALVRQGIADAILASPAAENLSGGAAYEGGQSPSVTFDVQFRGRSQQH